MRPARSLGFASALGGFLASAALAGPPSPQRVDLHRVRLAPSLMDQSGQDDGGVAGGCTPVVSSHTSSDFGPGQYIVQAGMIEGEISATSFVLPADAFPIRVDLMEFLFATSAAAVETTTVYSVKVWEGPPNNFNGLVFSATSDGKLLPHLVMPPGTTGVNIQFLVDPGDPDQIWVADNGSHTVSIGIEIVEHNQPPTNQCLTPPPPQFNAFPCTDVDGLQSPTGNWIYIVDCGIFGCPPGWKRFSDLPSVCRPSGDWVQRLTWTPGGCDSIGACCLGGNCDLMSETECAAAGGAFQGVGTQCADIDCSQEAPCCFAATGGCVELEVSDCVLAGGVPGTVGDTCAGHICFPEGACCLPDGSCANGLSPEECAALSGTFQGDGTVCSGVNCPAPTGAACFPNGFCLVLTEVQAIAAGATWQGPGTNCADLDANGTADACDAPDIPCDFDHNGLINGADLSVLLSGWGEPGITDLDGNGTTGGSDLAILLAKWTG